MVIRQFDDGSYLEYANGSFDKWCVYIVNGNERIAPRDIDYFNDLLNIGNIYGVEKVYNDFVSVYNVTGKNLDSNVLNLIVKISNTYNSPYREIIEKDFTIIYAGMIAEENKKNTKLGKRIKRLGIYKLLIEGNNVNHSATFMKGMGWRQIDQLCKQRGF